MYGIAELKFSASDHFVKKSIQYLANSSQVAVTTSGRVEQLCVCVCSTGVAYICTYMYIQYTLRWSRPCVYFRSIGVLTHARRKAENQLAKRLTPDPGCFIYIFVFRFTATIIAVHLFFINN